MAKWDPESILALAPDPASAKAGAGLASPAKWPLLGSDDRAVWGLAQGSGKDPYQAAIDLTEPAFRCSCPSRKFPCKHTLGLFLLYARGGCPSSVPPDWCQDWLAKRDAKSSAPPKVEATPDPSSQAKRAAKREERVAEGLAELSVWLRDAIRQGLASPAVSSPQAWSRVASRLVDAQAPGAARILREAADITGADIQSHERRIEKLAILHLITESYKRIATLPDSTQSDLRTTIGWTIRKEELPKGTTTHWTVVMQRSFEEDRIRVQCSWLFARESKSWAMVLGFAAGPSGFDVSLLPGTGLNGRLGFYPSALPLRAAVFESQITDPSWPMGTTAAEALASYAEALSLQPWIEVFPFALRNVYLAANVDAKQVIDSEGTRLPLQIDEKSLWQLLAVSGGRSLDLYGEWNGHELRVLAALAEGRWMKL